MIDLSHHDFSQAMHDLLLTLENAGLGLVLLPAPRSNPGDDSVECLREAVANFARVKGMSDAGKRLLHNYLTDHLFEQGPDGIQHVPIWKGPCIRRP